MAPKDLSSIHLTELFISKCQRRMHLVSALDQPFISSGGQTSPVTEPHAGDKCTSIALELPGWGMLSVRGDSRLEVMK